MGLAGGRCGGDGLTDFVFRELKRPATLGGLYGIRRVSMGCAWPGQPVKSLSVPAARSVHSREWVIDRSLLPEPGDGKSVLPTSH